LAHLALSRDTPSVPANRVEMNPILDTAEVNFRGLGRLGRAGGPYQF